MAGEDWLDGDNEAQRAEMQARALEFSRLYLVFKDDGRAAQILEAWERVLEPDIPVNATINEYVSREARRAFVRGIRKQIEIANSGTWKP